MTEQWKPVVGYETHYAVSDHGRVKRTRANQGARSGHVLKVFAGASGHLKVGLHVNREKQTVSVHRLVLEAFVGPCPEGMECCHGDGNPANNRLGNLRWDTRLANTHDKKRHGTHVKGEDVGNSKLTVGQVREIRELYAQGKVTQQTLADWFSVSRTLVSNVVNRKTWSHVL